jgi:hypothetical protein
MQFTFHHPIGVTVLGADEWVVTPTSDIKYLEANKSWPELSAWAGRKQAFAREAIIADGHHGRRRETVGGADVVLWVDVAADIPACSAGIVQYQAAARAAGKKDADWLEFAPLAVQAAEARWKAAQKDARWAQAFAEARPVGSTMGGATGNVPQTAVAFLGTAPPAVAYSVVRNRALGLTPDSYAAPALPAPVVPAPPAATPPAGNPPAP